MFAQVEDGQLVGFDSPRSKETGIRKQPNNGLLQA